MDTGTSHKQHLCDTVQWYSVADILLHALLFHRKADMKQGSLALREKRARDLVFTIGCLCTMHTASYYGADDAL